MSKIPFDPPCAKNSIQGQTYKITVFFIFLGNGEFYRENRSDKTCRSHNSLQKWFKNFFS